MSGHVPEEVVKRGTNEIENCSQRIVGAGLHVGTYVALSSAPNIPDDINLKSDISKMYQSTVLRKPT